MKSSSVWFTSIFCTLVTSPALARETPIIGGRPRAPASVEVHPEAPDAAISESASDQRQHRGLYLRTEFGAGYRSLSAEADGLAVDISGAGVGASLLLGGTPLPNLVLLGELSYSGIPEPSVRANEQSVEPDGASVTLLAFGPGLLYHVMPANFSLGASLLLTRFTLSRDGDAIAESELGFGGSIRLGKEWWVGQHTGFGLSAQCAVASMNDESDDAAQWLGTAYTLSATLTYN